MIQEWFEEFLSSGIGKLHTASTHNFIIYRGFKIFEYPETDTYEIVDVRFSDFYSEVREKDLDHLKRYGFVKGADLLMLERDLFRVESSRKCLEMLYQMKNDLPSKSKEMTARKYKLKQNGLKKEINKHINRMFFHESRKNQIQNKYQIEDE